MTGDSASRDYNSLFKLVLVGDTSVGKSCLLLKFADDAFSENYIATIGVDFRFRSMRVNEQTVKLQIWDTAGQERFRTITSAYYRGAEAIIVVYDGTSRRSFESVASWLEEVGNYVGEDVPIVIIANKKDLEGEVPIQEARDQYPQYIISETSAKSGDGVEDAFADVARELLRRKQERVEEVAGLTTKPDVKLGDSDPVEHWCNLCGA